MLTEKLPQVILYLERQIPPLPIITHCLTWGSQTLHSVKYFVCSCSFSRHWISELLLKAPDKIKRNNKYKWHHCGHHYKPHIQSKSVDGAFLNQFTKFSRGQITVGMSDFNYLDTCQEVDLFRSGRSHRLLVLLVENFIFTMVEAKQWGQLS